MLSKAKTLQGYKLDSRDGEIGKVKEFYFAIWSPTRETGLLAGRC
jgi:hypothetical protein